MIQLLMSLLIIGIQVRLGLQKDGNVFETVPGLVENP